MRNIKTRRTDDGLSVYMGVYYVEAECGRSAINQLNAELEKDGEELLSVEEIDYIENTPCVDYFLGAMSLPAQDYYLEQEGLCELACDGDRELYIRYGSDCEWRHTSPEEADKEFVENYMPNANGIACIILDFLKSAELSIENGAIVKSGGVYDGEILCSTTELMNNLKDSLGLAERGGLCKNAKL